MTAIAIPAGSSHIRRVGVGVGVGVGGTDFFGGPGRAGVMRCQVLTNGTRSVVSSVGNPRATPSSGARHGCRYAHAAPAQSALGSRPAVAGSDRIMLLSGVPARARRVWRRIGARCCRHKVAPPRCQHACSVPSQPHLGRARNDQSRMSPSPQPIASALIYIRGSRPAARPRMDWTGRDVRYRTAIGLTGEPVPCRSRSGAITQKKDQRPAASQSGTRSSNCR